MTLGLGLAASCTPLPAATTIPPSTASHSDDDLAGLSWLAGTWASDDPIGSRTVEHWLRPEGGTMLAVNRTAHEGATVFFEYLRIEATPDGPVLLASPLGRHPPTRFPATVQGATSIVFENPEHDYPQRIEYERIDERLHMRIAGTQDGKDKSGAWVLHRTVRTDR